MTSPEARRTAADKTLDVLEALAEHQSIAGLSEATKLPKPTVHRILRTLVERGFARQTDHGSYTGGPRILTLIGRHQRGADLTDRVRPALEELARETNWTVHFALLSGHEAVYAAKVEGDRPYHLASRVGMSLPLHSTSVGKSMLAALPEESARALLARGGMPRRTARTHTDAAALLAELAAVRRRGWAEDQEENEEGVIAVGAPVFDHVGQVIGGISAAALSHPADAKAMTACGRAVATTARQVSLTLGAPPQRSDLAGSPD
ncbi:IclR family transcriptional regulator [Streptomyces johnsoniae]|uniref:IclR family transcriptional regulator n=1 Tax=Streptomyces johnsoniae TaxID=3075532 RepID=A0ABU2S3T9_9ACTN|nr:IclR family transcriptional regulator [Streptomyces sp. DSM 41886]MDT0443089.1 IclR family transcriptional regulator [Streptomyces sp. DSM 41886]